MEHKKESLEIAYQGWLFDPFLIVYTKYFPRKETCTVKLCTAKLLSMKTQPWSAVLFVEQLHLSDATFTSPFCFHANKPVCNFLWILLPIFFSHKEFTGFNTD
jgi:hypothetical protein